MAFTYNPSSSTQEKKKRLDETSTYAESPTVSEARNKYYDSNNAYQNSLGWNRSDSQYGNQLDTAIGNILNRDKFEYNFNTDALYNQYKDQYKALGGLAMTDTVNEAKGLRGGYGDTYINAAAQQATDQYLDRQNDMLPELYQLALDTYSVEGDNLYNAYDALKQGYSIDYNEHRDKVNDLYNLSNLDRNAYLSERNADYNAFTSDRNAALNSYNNERDFDYTSQKKTYDTEVEQRQAALEAAQEAAQAAAKSKSSGSGKKSTSSGKKTDDTATATQDTASDYDDWDAGDWEEYFAKIRESEGTDAAKEEQDRLIKSGALKNKYMFTASAGVRGKQGFGH